MLNLKWDFIIVNVTNSGKVNLELFRSFKEKYFFVNHYTNIWNINSRVIHHSM